MKIKNLVKKFGQENAVDKKVFAKKNLAKKMFVQNKVSVSKYFTRKKLDPTFFSGDF